MKTSRGFTLLELAVAMTVFITLVTIGVPNYRNFVATQKVRTASYDLVSALVFARSEAIKRNTTVSVTQAAGGWVGGWNIVAGTSLLRTQNPYSNGVTIANSASIPTLTYSNDGRIATAPTDFTIAFTGIYSTVTPRCVSIKPGGVPVTKLGSC